MSDQERALDADTKAAGVNPGYAAFQLAKALTTSREYDDSANRARAAAKCRKWESVLRNVIAGAVASGSRTPVDCSPAWATLDVVTGGFATGALLAGGSLQQHEQCLLQKLQTFIAGEERNVLNSHFRTEDARRVPAFLWEPGTQPLTE